MNICQVRVDVNICYCAGDKCNKKDIYAGSDTQQAFMVQPSLSLVVLIMFCNFV